MNTETIKCIIIDDEQKAISVLIGLLNAFVPNIEIIGSRSTAESARELINSTSFDLLFLDVDMPLENGFELLESINEPSFETIFVTAFDQYAIKALRMSALDYILKPVDPDDLINAVSRLKKKKGRGSTLKYEHFKSQYNEGKFDQLLIPSTDGISVLKLKEIIRFEADNNYTRIFTETSYKPILVSKTLKHFERTLEDTAFVRIHKSHIINSIKIREYYPSTGSRVELLNGEKIAVSRSKRHFLKEFLANTNYNLGK